MQTIFQSTERRSAGARAGTVLLAIVLGVLVGAGALAVFAHRATSGVWDRIATRVTGRSLAIDISQPTVVSRIQRLERLETVTYTMDKVVEGQRSNAILPDFLVGDKLLLLVHGQAIAGVDMQQLKPSDVTVRGKASPCICRPRRSSSPRLTTAARVSSPAAPAGLFRPTLISNLKCGQSRTGSARLGAERRNSLDSPQQRRVHLDETPA